ncbi:MAG TPA: hypothetical protein PL182_13580, partial [Pseudobdellovibrionaceae bacterium]|nr:hypothetical protein [Pseudobdellovibrionaceae bacterium]
MKAHQKYFAFVMMVLSVMLASMAARAQNEMDLSCRAKAKETALEIYQGCMTESRALKIKTIRDGYRSEMASVKAKYESMLKDMKGTEAAAKAATAPTPTTVTKAAPALKAVRPARAEQPVSGIAKTLPAKQFDNGPALPIQNATSDLTVVPTPEVEMAGVTNPDLKEIGDESG